MVWSWSKNEPIYNNIYINRTDGRWYTQNIINSTELLYVCNKDNMWTIEKECSKTDITYLYNAYENQKIKDLLNKKKIEKVFIKL